MFAQVACQLCGKPFQVPKAQLGQTVACSWCEKPTVAVPLAVKAQPLPPDAPPSRGGFRSHEWIGWAGYGMLLLLVAGGVFVGVRLLSGDGGLREFTAPDGSCTAMLPGTPREQAAPDDEFLKSGRRFVSEPGWGSKVRGEVGWFDVPDGQLARANDLFVLLRDRRANELGATVDSEAAVRVDSHYGREVRFVNGDVWHVERYLFDPKADRPRVYWVSVGGVNLDEDLATAAKVTGSLRVR